MSDQTPAFRWSVLGKWTVLDIIMPHGLWRGEAWDRYFLNEKEYDATYTPEHYTEAYNKVFPHDLDTAEGR